MDSDRLRLALFHLASRNVPDDAREAAIATILAEFARLEERIGIATDSLAAFIRGDRERIDAMAADLAALRTLFARLEEKARGAQVLQRQLDLAVAALQKRDEVTTRDLAAIRARVEALEEYRARREPPSQSRPPDVDAYCPACGMRAGYGHAGDCRLRPKA